MNEPVTHWQPLLPRHIGDLENFEKEQKRKEYLPRHIGDLENYFHLSINSLVLPRHIGDLEKKL